MLIITNPDAQILAAEAGELDILSDIARPSDIDRLGADPKLKMSLARGMHAFFLLLNNKNFPWDDAAVRRAAAMSIDRGAIVRMIFSGYCEPINSWLPPVSPWALANSSRDIYDPEGAAKLLEERGYTRDITGALRSPDGQPFPKMKILTPLARLAPTTAELAELIAGSLTAAGFPAETEPMDFSTMIARLDRKEYDMAVLAWGMGRNPDSLYSFYHSSMDFPGGYNMTGVRDARLDAALERAMREMRKERGEKESEWEVRFTKTLQLGRLYSIVILFGFPGERDGFDPGLKGFVQANRNRAVTIEPLHPGVEPDPLADAEEVFRATVHYEAVQVAAGILAVPQVTAEVDEAEGLVRFRWEADEGEGEDRHRNDLVYGVVACPAFGDCRIRELGKRGESGECVIPARPQWKGLELWAYVFSTTEDGMDASGSACVAERVVINNVALTMKG